MIRRGLDRWGAVASATEDADVGSAIDEMVNGYLPDCELDFTRTLPDFPVSRGPEAMVNWMRGARIAMAGVKFTAGEMVEKTDALIVPVRVTAQTRDTKALIQMDYVYLFRFAGDKIAAATSYRTVEEALEAANGTA